MSNSGARSGPDGAAAEDTWRRQREAMVAGQLRARGLRDERVLAAMGEVPREQFVLPEYRRSAYDDSPLPLGHGATISQPYMVALMLELLQVQPGHRVLEIGAGSGYQAALLSRLAREVWGVEIIPELARRAADTLARLGYGNAHLIAGDGSGGYPEAAPYDRIIVAAGAPQVPQPLVEQLAMGGRLVAPVGPRYTQRCLVLEKTPDGLVEQGSISCVFVPLVGEHGWSQDDDS
jgi:protein-L-isoaspartate(D-aspartate) O-methyltransferase